MGLFRPQLSGKYLCFLPPSHLAKQTAALSCGKRAEASGSMVRASRVPWCLTHSPGFPLRPKKLTYTFCAREFWPDRSHQRESALFLGGGEHPRSPLRCLPLQDINILGVGSVTWLTKSLKVYCLVSAAAPSHSSPPRWWLHPVGAVRPTLCTLAALGLACSLFLKQVRHPPQAHTACQFPWSEVPWHKTCRACRACQPHLGRWLCARSIQEPAERFQLSPENSIIFPGHPSWGGEGRRRPLRWLMLLSGGCQLAQAGQGPALMWLMPDHLYQSHQPDWALKSQRGLTGMSLFLLL